MAVLAIEVCWHRDKSRSGLILDAGKNKGSTMPRNILEVIHSISEDKTFTPTQNLAQISKVAKGFAPMLTEILQDYLRQNIGVSTQRVERIKAARQMLGEK